MKFLNKMERKFGRYAIKNLTMFIIATYVLGYVLEFVAPNLTVYLLLDPYYILHGQIWRLVSWLLIPPESLDIFTIIMLFFYYSIGTTLERTWGSFRYNVYIFGGILWTIIGSFVLYIILLVQYGTGVPFEMMGYAFTTYYVSMAIFLGFAMTYPDMQVLLYFIIPLKIKYLAYLDVAYLVYAMVRGNIFSRIVIICSLMNAIIYFLMTRNYRRIDPREIHRKQTFKKAVNPGSINRARTGSAISRHKCAICGRTELDDPTLEFRFCSRCNGNYEYCQDHLFNHKHVE